MSKLFDQLMEQRGLEADFLRPRYEALTDPFVFPDMTTAVERLSQAIARHERILIFGDYDVDGVTASTLMAGSLQLAGVQPSQLSIMLPDRFTDGYGMSPRLLTRATDEGTTLVITVDCGTGSREIIEEFSRRGIDTIVTDHHECLAELPSAVAVLNPKRPDFPPAHQDLRNLAGVGVAFKFAQALVARGLIPAGQEKWLLDLVLIGTVCDNMPLTGENRTLCYYGAKVLAKTRRVGLRELLRSAGVRHITSDAIGYQLGPRLNAAGRLETADLSLALLTTTSPAEAARLALCLEELNTRRRTEQQSALAEIEQRGLPPDPVIVEVGHWHEGVLGIIAGRLTETYHRPCFVLSEVENGTLKGSGRSFGDFSLAAALDDAHDCLISGGGHAGAAGVRLYTRDLDAFRARLNDFYRAAHLGDQEHFWHLRADLPVAELDALSLDFLAELAQLEPFGTGNERPIFELTAVRIEAVDRLGAARNHLRLTVRDDAGRRLKLMAFHAPEAWLNLTPDDHISPLIQLEANDFRGVTSVEGRILDLGILAD